MKHVELKISKGMTTLIDQEDFDRLVAAGRTKWNAQKVGKRYYVSSSFYRPTHRSPKVYLHRFIMDCPDGMCIDHINGDSLDNRKINLRICSYRDNSANKKSKKKYKGVVKTHNGMWQAQISANGIHATLGAFTVESEAARVYDLAAALLYGEFAVFNFPFSKKFLKFGRVSSSSS